MIKNQSGGVMLIIILVIVLIVVGASAFYFGKSTAQIGPVQPQQSQSPQASTSGHISTPITYNNPPLAAYMNEVNSPDGKYTFAIDFDDQGRNNCKYSISEKGRTGKFTLKSIGDTIPCYQGPVNESVFLGLGDTGELAVGQEAGKIAIISIAKDSFVTHVYDPTLPFIATNPDFTKWLYNKPQANFNKVTYLLKDQNNRLLKEITLGGDDQTEYSSFRVLGDMVNNGFLFVSRKYQPLHTPSDLGNTEVSYKFDFLSAKDLDYKTFLTTDYVVVPGRGCSGDFLTSIKGEIIIMPSCIIVNDKYLASDKKIHLKL